MLRAERARTRCSVSPHFLPVGGCVFANWPESSLRGIDAQIGLMHGASDGVDVRGGNVQGEEDKSVGREQENNEEERTHMSMDLTLE